MSILKSISPNKRETVGVSLYFEIKLLFLQEAVFTGLLQGLFLLTHQAPAE